MNIYPYTGLWDFMLTDIFTNFVISGGFIVIATLALWCISLKIKSFATVDVFWGAGIAVIAVLCLLAKLHLSGGSGFFWQMWSPYMLLLAALPIVLGLRVSLYMLWRNWGDGVDENYTGMQARVAPKKWRLYVLRNVYFDQALAMLVVTSPIWVAMALTFFMQAPAFEPYALADGTKVQSASTMISVPFGTLSIIGASVWLVGFLFEAIGDWQLARFMVRRYTFGAEAGEEITGTIMDKGLWRYTRHPNYFGNALMWWGIWIVACQAPLGWVTIISPLFMTLAMVKLTGAEVLEKSLSQRPAYADYMQRTHMFLPWFPRKPDRVNKNPEHTVVGSAAYYFNP